MKKCPQCGLSLANNVEFCICGYRFSVPKTGIRRSISDVLSWTPHGREGWVMALFSIVGLVPSFICILSSLSNTALWVSDEGCHVDQTIDDMRFFVLLIGLLVGGGCLYSLIVTKGFAHWHLLDADEQAAVFLLALAGAVLTIVLICAWQWSTQCWSQ